MKKLERKTLTGEDVSVDVILERRQRSYSCGEPRPRGSHIAARAEALELKPASITRRTRKVASADEERLAIRNVIERFEKLPPDRVVETHGVLTTDPYTAISDGEATKVDVKTLKSWVKSPLFRNLSERFTGELELVDLKIDLIDERTAAATYTITQDRVFGTSAVVLVKEKDGEWRISVHCQHPISG